MTYARTTKVTTDATRSAIERELHKHEPLAGLRRERAPLHAVPGGDGP